MIKHAGLIPVLLIISFLTGCGGSMSDNVLYDQLIEIMRSERAGQQPYRRPKDVTDLVCPLVDEEKLMALSSDNKLSRRIEFRDYPEGISSDPTPQKRWQLWLSLGIMNTRELTIKFNPIDGTCRASVLTRTV